MPTSHHHKTLIELLVQPTIHLDATRKSLIMVKQTPAKCWYIARYRSPIVWSEWGKKRRETRAWYFVDIVENSRSEIQRRCDRKNLLSVGSLYCWLTPAPMKDPFLAWKPPILTPLRTSEGQEIKITLVGVSWAGSLWHKRAGNQPIRAQYPKKSRPMRVLNSGMRSVHDVCAPVWRSLIGVRRKLGILIFILSGGSTIQ